MTYRGKVMNGVVVIENGGKLPDGTAVEVLPIQEEEQLSSLAERFAGLIGKAEGLPSDLAENHDHYLHGQPKRHGQ